MINKPTKQMNYSVEELNELLDSIDDLKAPDLDAYQTKNDSGLATTNKTIVGAINELFQSANNGKQIIADAIGEPLNANDTFSAMGNKMDGLLDTFKTNMSNQGVPVESNDKFASLINKIPMIQGNGKIQYATGNLNIAVAFSDPGGDADDAHERTDSYDIDLDLDFEPSIIFVHINHEHTNEGDGANVQSMCISNLFETTIKGLSTGALENSATYVKLSITDLTSKGFKLTRYFNPYFESYSYTARGEENLLSFYAIGITNEEEADDLSNNTRILTGMYRTMALTDNGEIWSCGHYTSGMLGYTDHDYQDVRQFKQVTTGSIDNPKQIVGGEDYVLLLKTNGEFSGVGQIDNDIRNLEFEDISSINDIKQLCSTGGTSYVVKNDGTLWAIGVGTSGQLGLGNSANVTEWTQVTTNVSDVNKIFCGARSLFMVKNDGTLWGCGDNRLGKLGIGDASTVDVTAFRKISIDINANNIKNIAFGSHHTLILMNDGTVWGVGDNSYGQFGVEEIGLSFVKLSLTNVNKIACGYNHTILLKDNGTLWSAGDNVCGQLGLGHANEETSFCQITMNTDNAVDVMCGGDCSFIIKNNGEVWSCGDNEYGQLGINSTATSILTFTRTNLNMN